MGCESQVLGEKVNFFNSLGIIEFQAFINFLFILILPFSKYLQNNLNSQWFFMKFCNLGDQSQFEISNLNGHWINTNNAPLLVFLVPNNGD